MSPRCVFFAAGLAAALPALAGGGPENVLIVIDPSSRESMYLGNYYRAARNIPEANVLYMDPDATDFPAFLAAQHKGLLGQLRQRGLEDHIDYVVVTPGNSFYVSAPGLVSDGCSPVTRFSIGSVFTLAHVVGDIIPGPIASTNPNRYYSNSPTQVVAFDSNTLWLNGLPSTSASARRYFIGALLGYSGPNGNSLDDIKAMIDRCVAADGTFPAGTVYYMNNTNDPIRNVRACGTGSCSGTPVLYNLTASNMLAAGGLAEVLPGDLPFGRHDATAIMSGFSTANVLGGDFTLLPGSFADHLTSYAAAFDDTSQTKCTEWITRGASASAGTVDEPCNYLGKFPHSNMHVIYRRGLSMGEAYFRSLGFTPFQQLFVGDPVTRAYTHIPTVNVPDAPTGPVSGTILLTPQGQTTHPQAVVASFELLVDGVLRGTTTPGGSFTLKTVTLDDGVHDLRVLAYDNSLIRSVGRWTGSITVSNLGRAATLVPLQTTGSLTDLFTFQLGATGGSVAELRLVHNGRVVAARATPGPVQVHGQMLGAGAPRVRAEALFADGRRAVSAPVVLSIAFAAGTPAGAAPVAFGYSRTLLNDAPAVIELPATFDADPAGATYTVLSPPSQASIAGSGGWRVLSPVVGACGPDQLTFRVQTPAGQSGVATVALRWARPASACPPDFNNDGALTIADFGAFQTAFVLGDMRADFNGDCLLTIADFGAFQSAFVAGCP